MAKSERSARHPWSVPVLQAEVPQSGRHFDLAADEHTRAAIARLAGVVDLPRFEASFHVTAHGPDGLRAVGRVSATVIQTCSVTLDPMTSEVNEDVDAVFLPSPTGLPATTNGRDVEVLLENEPEALIDGTIDLAALATEFLVLGITPYPRKPDSVFEAPACEPKSPGPFAALAGLQKDIQTGPSNSPERKKG
jgi:uncharacterized metal-binding protein YceD (DUF177 family)